jgi:hypothetical protein
VLTRRSEDEVMTLLKFILLTFVWVSFGVFSVWGLLWLHFFQPSVALAIGVILPGTAVSIYLRTYVIVPFRQGLADVPGDKN